VGAGILVVVAVLFLVVLYGLKMGWWEERRLILVTVDDPGELMVGSPVWFQGVEIGEVTRIKGPEQDSPGWKLRLAVEDDAFMHIPLDAPVRVDKSDLKQPWRVTILPGKLKPDRDFPGKVKVLRQVSDEEELLRMFRDVLGGLIDLAESKTGELEQGELKKEIDRLRSEISRLKKGSEKGGNNGREN